MLLFEEEEYHEVVVMLSLYFKLSSLELELFGAVMYS